jgi:hypothetical protein
MMKNDRVISANRVGIAPMKRLMAKANMAPDASAARHKI